MNHAAAYTRGQRRRNESPARLSRISIIAIGIVIVIAPVPLRAQSGAETKTTVADDPIRGFAESTVLPLYPESSKRAHETGVAVAQIRLDQKRRLQQVDVLEAPSDAIKAAVIEALQKWRFRAASDDPPGTNLAGATLTGKVTFYFYVSGDRYVVAGPKEAPNLRTLERP